jgi:hypothetical protein
VHAHKPTQRLPGTARRTPVYVVCSPRARVGKTLIARLLIDFFRIESRPVAGCDLNRNEPSLANYFPGGVIKADIGKTTDQMALFDGLVVNDGIGKVVDVGAEAFAPFFDVVQQIGFAGEARRRSVQPLVLFVMDVDRSSADAFSGLQRRLPGLPVIAVHNEAVVGAYRLGVVGQLRIPVLPPVLKGVVEKPSFSFAHEPVGTQSLLAGWLEQIFVQFREFELRLLLKELSQQIRA